MKYGETIKNSTIPEWADKYMDYEDLKYYVEQLGQIDTMLEENVSEQQTYVLVTTLNDIDDVFWQQLRISMDLVNKFFNEQLLKMVQLVDEIKQHYKLIFNLNTKDLKQVDNYKQNMQEVYKTITMLGTFGIMNTNGYRKVVKKRNKMAKNHIFNGQQKYTEILNNYDFHKEEKINEQQNQLEEIWCQIEKINKKEARTQLMTYCSAKLNAEYIRIRSATGNGFTFGLAISLFSSFVYAMWTLNEYTNVSIFQNHQLILKSIRIYLCLTFHIICIGTDILCFERRRLNYIFILELPPAQIISSYRTYFKICFTFLIILLFNITLCVCRLYIDQKILPAWVWLSIPLVFPLLYSIFVIIGWKSHKKSLARFIIHVIGKQFTPWKHRVSFPVFFIGDQLTSVTGLFADFVEILTYGYAPDYVLLIAANIPCIIRIIQCIIRYREKYQFYPHMINMFKYVSSIPGTFLYLNIVNKYQAAYYVIIVLKLIESVYKLYWDFAEDWALFTGGTGVKEFQNQQNKWQNKIVCKRPSFFRTDILLVACFYNLFARLIWITRRCMWNVLRVDNQQATNCEGYALTRYIPVLLTQQERLQLSEERNQQRTEVQKHNVENIIQLKHDAVLAIEENSDKLD